MIEKKPLSELSYDNDNKIVVCDYKNSFIDLDTTKGMLHRSHSPESPDMLYIDEKKREIWFVEFKSSNAKNLNSHKNKIKLRKKIFAGLFLVYEIFCEKCSKYRTYDKFYYVVYNKVTQNYEDELLDSFEEESSRDIEFGLEDLKPNFLKDIFTENCDSLKELFQKRFRIEFIK